MTWECIAPASPPPAYARNDMPHKPSLAGPSRPGLLWNVKAILRLFFDSRSHGVLHGGGRDYISRALQRSSALLTHKGIRRGSIYRLLQMQAVALAARSWMAAVFLSALCVRFRTSRASGHHPCRLPR